jgi:hypothetical protein
MTILPFDMPALVAGITKVLPGWPGSLRKQSGFLRDYLEIAWRYRANPAMAH